MPEQTSTLLTKDGGEKIKKGETKIIQEEASMFPPVLQRIKKSRKEGKAIMNKELQVKLKGNLIITTLGQEGLVFEGDTRKSFWINETAAFLLRLFEANDEGACSSSARSLLQEQYLADDGSKLVQDFASFINQLEGFGLVSFQSLSNGTNGARLKSPNGEAKRYYLRPVIEEEADVLSITGATSRASRMAASRSAAVSRATAAGFRGFG